MSHHSESADVVHQSSSHIRKEAQPVSRVHENSVNTYKHIKLSSRSSLSFLLRDRFPANVVFAQTFVIPFCFIRSSQFLRHKIANTFYFLAIPKTYQYCLAVWSLSQKTSRRFYPLPAPTLSTLQLPFMVQ